MKKYTKKELFEMDAVEVYRLVLQGKITRFPKGFWMQPEAKQNASKCVRFLMEDILKFTDEEIKKELSTKLFRKYNLGGMMKICYNNSPYEVINAVYPNKFKPWEFKYITNGYWNDRENAIKATKWLIEEKLKLSDEELKKQLSVKMFVDNGLLGMMNICFNGSPYDAINLAYQNKFKPWEFNQVSNGYWKNINNGIMAIKWLVEEKLKLSDEELREQLSREIFKKNNLIGMLENCFNGSPYEAINAAYPGKFKPWEFKSVSMGYWKDKENAVKATKWLIEEKLKLSDEELKEQLSTLLFNSNGLIGMLNNCFNGSPYEAIKATYPNKFKPWEFKYIPNGYWSDKDNTIKATKWMVEEKLRLTDKELKEQLSVKIFMDHGLHGMLNICFKGSPYEAINTAYPGKFKKEDFKNYR